MKRVFGLETEYGITITGAESIDVVAQSIELVRSYTEQGALMKWDYASEDPHRDARGFRAAELLQDTDESAYYEIDKNRPLRFEEIKSDLVLCNGARFYNDHAHPEYSTPECTTLRELVAQEKAGERILAECARRRNQKLPPEHEVRLYKNNTDFDGHSYGCHDNYLMRRDVPWDRIVSGVLPFLVTRQIFAGAGKMGIEAESAVSQPGVYQISQRADFFSVIVSIDTMNRRPLVNTRDEPHADAEHYRRLHVIVGDSNMSETTTMLKVGATDLVLRMVESGQVLRDLTLENPIRAIREISHDITGRRTVKLANGRELSALEIQTEYYERARDFADRNDLTSSVHKAVLDLWQRSLHAIGIGDLSLIETEIDWVIKHRLIERYRAKHNLELSSPRIAQIDLAYHDIHRRRGLYYLMQRRGQIERVTSDVEIFEAKSVPPQTTRAKLRGEFVRRAQERRRDFTVDWVHLKLNDQAQRTVLCKDPFASVDERVARLIASM